MVSLALVLASAWVHAIGSFVCWIRTSATRLTMKPSGGGLLGAGVGATVAVGAGVALGARVGRGVGAVVGAGVAVGITVGAGVEATVGAGWHCGCVGLMSQVGRAASTTRKDGARRVRRSITAARM